MIVLGIDPGFTATGYGIIRYNKGKGELLDYGLLKMSSRNTLAKRIEQFYTFFTQKIMDFHVTDLALETPFLGKNAQNFLKLGYLRGTLFLLTSQHNLILHEFSPREVKHSLTGYGAAEKDQVARVVLRLFPRMTMPDKYDITDALAVMLCGLWRSQSNRVR